MRVTRSRRKRLCSLLRALRTKLQRALAASRERLDKMTLLMTKQRQSSINRVTMSMRIVRAARMLTYLMRWRTLILKAPLECTYLMPQFSITARPSLWTLALCELVLLAMIGEWCPWRARCRSDKLTSMFCSLLRQIFLGEIWLRRRLRRLRGSATVSKFSLMGVRAGLKILDYIQMLKSGDAKKRYQALMKTVILIFVKCVSDGLYIVREQAPRQKLFNNEIDWNFWLLYP